MKGKVCVGLVLAVVATACLCRPAAEAPGAVGDPRRLPTSLVRRDWPEPLSQEQQHLISRFLPHMFAGTTAPRDAQGGHPQGNPIRHSPAPVPGGSDPAPFAPAELRDRKGFVQGDEGDEALHDHFYPDWMDFGRRSSEDSAA